MKKLCILTSAMLLTAIIHAAAGDMANITVQGARVQELASFQIHLNVDLNTETFRYLAERINKGPALGYNRLALADYPNEQNQQVHGPIGLFVWIDRLGGPVNTRNADDASTLRAAGIRNGQILIAQLPEEWERERGWLPGVKEPQVD